MTDWRARALAFDLKRLDAAFLADPFPVYRALREHDPIHRMPDGSYFLSRYDDCATVYRDPETWSSDKTVDFRPNLGDGPLYEHHTTSLVFNDPPYHSRVRKLLAPAFTPRSLMALQPRIEALVDRLLDRAAARGGMDLIADFAAAVPIQLVGDMLGVPETERGPLRGWSLAILGALEPVLTAEQVERGVQAVEEFKAYLRDLIDRRGREPSRDEGEILSKLTAGSALGPGDPSGERLSERTSCSATPMRSASCGRIPVSSGPRWRSSSVSRARISSATAGRRGTPSWAAFRCRPARTCTSASGPPTAIRPSFPSRTGSRSAGIPTGTWPSAPASTPAPACGWPAWKARWRSAVSCSASKTSSPTARSCAVAGPASAGSSAIPFACGGEASPRRPRHLSRRSS